MSNDNVIEIDFDEDQVSEEMNPGDVVLPSMDSPEGSATLRAGIVGDNFVSNSIQVQFGCPAKPTSIVLTKYKTIDEAAESTGNHIFFVCTDFKVDDKVVDDAELVDAVNKLFKHQQGTVIVKTAVNLDTLEKLLKVCVPDRFVYAPEITTYGSLDESMRAKVELVGGTQKAVQDYVNFITRHSIYDRELVTSNPFDIAVLKMVINSYKAVFQTFWNQINDYSSDKMVSYPWVKKTFNQFKTDFLETIPAYVKAQAEGATYKKAKSFGGEYLNKEVVAFSESTDKFPLLDECINYKNLKD